MFILSSPLDVHKLFLMMQSQLNRDEGILSKILTQMYIVTKDKILSIKNILMSVVLELCP